MGKRIAGILFNLGETILDFGQVDLRALFRRGAELAYAYLTDRGYELPPFEKYLYGQLRAVRWSILRTRLTGIDFNSLDVIRRVGLRGGIRLDHRDLVELAGLWYEPLSRCASVEEGVPELLREFRNEGLVLGIISNTFVPGEVLDRHLDREGLIELLPVRVYSCDVGCRKPSRRIFQIALNRADLSPTEALFVGDSLWADVWGANRSGIPSVLKDPHGRHTGRWIKPAHHVRSLLELRRIVAGYDRDPTERRTPR